MNKNILFYTLFVSVTTIVSCGNDYEAERSNPETPVAKETQTNETTRPISVEVTENTLDDGTNRAEDLSTRTEITTKSSLSSFTMTGVHSSGNKEYSATKTSDWNISPNSWLTVGDNESIDFYAYTSGTFDSSNALLEVTVEGETSTQKDVLAAKKTTSYSASNGKVSLTFDHIMSAVHFNLQKSASLKDYTVEVKEVALCNVNKHGFYDYSNKSWTGIDTPTEFIIYSSSGITLTEKRSIMPSANDYMFLIPQALTAWDKTGTPSNCYLKLTCKIHKGSTYYIGGADSWGTGYIAFGPITLKGGHKQPITIEIGKGIRNDSGVKYINN